MRTGQHASKLSLRSSCGCGSIADHGCRSLRNRLRIGIADRDCGCMHGATGAHDEVVIDGALRDGKLEPQRMGRAGARPMMTCILPPHEAEA
jgi:hypothetical protein